MALDGHMTVSVKIDDEEREDFITGGDFGLEESASRNLGDGDRATGYIYKYFGDGYDATVNFSMINGQIDSFEGPYISDEEEGTEAEIMNSTIEVSFSELDDE